MHDCPRVAAILSHGVKGTNPILRANHYLRTTLAVTRSWLLLVTDFRRGRGPTELTAGIGPFQAFSKSQPMLAISYDLARVG